MRISILKFIIILTTLFHSYLSSQSQQFDRTFQAEIERVVPQYANRGTKISLHIKSKIGFDGNKLQVFFNDTIQAKIILVENARIDVIVPFSLNVDTNPKISIRRTGRNENLHTYVGKFQVGSESLKIIDMIPEKGSAGTEIRLELSYKIDTNANVKVLFTLFNDSILVVSPQNIEPKIITVNVPDLQRAGSQDISLKIDEYVTESRYNFIFQKDEPWITPLILILSLSILILILFIVYILRKAFLKKGKNEQKNKLSKTENKIIKTDLALPQPEPPDELIQAINSGDCILFVGAGLSARAGFPTWRPFIEGLLKWAIEKKYLDEYYSQALYSTIGTNEIDSVADSIVSNIKLKKGELDLIDYLKSVFIKPQVKLPNSHRLISDLKFASIITTNYDDLLTKTFRLSSENQSERQAIFTDKQSIGREFVAQDTQELLNAYAKKEFFLFNLYGSLDKPESIIVSPAEYKDMLASNRPLLQFMENIFYSRTLLFIGVSLQGIEDYLSGLNLATARGNRRHFALVDVLGSAWHSKADLIKRRFNIEILPFQASEKFPEVDIFLEKIIEKLDEKAAKETSSVSPGSHKNINKTSRLKSIKLENIGPFDSLHLKLDNQWNILLGDNGVGKSTILKAIAVGICGKDAEPFAHRLIKTGKTKAKIIIETTDNKEYLSEIFSVNGKAEINTVPSRLLESEGWLSLGFPPLRNLTWERPKAPQPIDGKGRPIPEDLLPLIKNEPDPRLDKLKQYIVNLDYRIKDDKIKNISNSPYERLLKEFFKFVDDITEGIKIEFKGVNPETKEVTIITDDGEVPLEMISQGTTSLIGWVGVTMQRFYEVYGHNGQPRDKYGLILIDEIDAHMHPGWQQKIVGNLRKFFPNVQFIATTHSPLIPIGSKPYEVQRLRRNPEETDKIIVETVDFDLRRWRADQVLTSPMFDLETTASPEINEAYVGYTELISKKDLTEEEKKKLEEYSELLKIKIPSPQEREEARKAFEIIEDSLNAKIAEIPYDKKKKVMDEIKAQIQENITQSRRS